jgi:hypothetical protein
VGARKIGLREILWLSTRRDQAAADHPSMLTIQIALEVCRDHPPGPSLQVPAWFNPSGGNFLSN